MKHLMAKVYKENLATTKKNDPIFRRFRVKERRRSENISDEKCYVYPSTNCSTSHRSRGASSLRQFHPSSAEKAFLCFFFQLVAA